MKQMNCWCSFYAFMYLETANKNVSLISSPIYLFPKKIVKMESMPNKVSKLDCRAQAKINLDA